MVERHIPINRKPAVRRVILRVALGQEFSQVEVVDLSRHRHIVEMGLAPDMRHDGSAGMCVGPGRGTGCLKPYGEEKQVLRVE